MTPWFGIYDARDESIGEVDQVLGQDQRQGAESLTPQKRTFLSHFAPPDDRSVRPT